MFIDVSPTMILMSGIIGFRYFVRWRCSGYTKICRSRWEMPMPKRQARSALKIIEFFVAIKLM
jgi:hypothetical protein